MNSIQAIDKRGTITLRSALKYRHPDEQKDPFVSIEIIDSGPGIPDEKLNQIFDPFYSSKYGNSGLGLAMVLKTVKNHNGEVKVDSKVNEYTCFKIILPCTTPNI